MNKENPSNLSRVLIQHINGAYAFAFYKDGMYLCDGATDWIGETKVKRFVTVEQLTELLKNIS